MTTPVPRFLAAIVLFVTIISGCQSTGKWATSWKDRKSKPEFQSTESPREEVTYWPYKAGKKPQKMTAIPSELKDKMAKKSEETRRDTELTDLIRDGDLLRKNNQMEEARLVYIKALKASPDNPDVNHRLAIVADMTGQFQSADDYYHAALRVKPRDVDILSDRGYSYLLRGNTEQAEMALKDALAIDPSHKLAMRNLGSLYARQNRYSEAMAMLRTGSTEADAQQAIAQLFPQGRPAGTGGIVPAGGPLNGGRTVTPAIAETTPDLSKLSYEQIRMEMERRAIDSKQKRKQADLREIEQYRSVAGMDDDLSPPSNPRQQQGTTPARVIDPQGMNLSAPRGANNTPSNNVAGNDIGSRQPGLGSPEIANSTPQNSTAGNSPSMNRSTGQDSRATSQTQIYRGTPGSQMNRPDPQLQQAWNGQPAGNPQQAGGPSQVSRTAMQLGMTMGPVNVFPFVPKSDNGIQAADPAAGYNVRLGDEYLQFMNSQAGQRGQSDNDPLGPASPATTWGSPATDHSASWQNMAPGASNWANEIQTGNGDAGTDGRGADGRGADGQGTPSPWGQTDSRASNDGFQNVQQSLRALNPNGNGNGNDAARPFKGPWPNSNSLPRGQSPSTTSTFGQSPSAFDMSGPGLQTAGDTVNFGNQNAPAGNANRNAVQQWPFAPNR